MKCHAQRFPAQRIADCQNLGSLRWSLVCSLRTTTCWKLYTYRVVRGNEDMSLKGSWLFSPSGLSSFCEVSSQWSPCQIFNLTARASLQKLVKRSERICNCSQTPELVDICWHQRCSCLGCCPEIPEIKQKLMENRNSCVAFMVQAIESSCWKMISGW